MTIILEKVRDFTEPPSRRPLSGDGTHSFHRIPKRLSALISWLAGWQDATNECPSMGKAGVEDFQPYHDQWYRNVCKDCRSEILV